MNKEEIKEKLCYYDLRNPYATVDEERAKKLLKRISIAIVITVSMAELN